MDDDLLTLYADIYLPSSDNSPNTGVAVFIIGVKIKQHVLLPLPLVQYSLSLIMIPNKKENKYDNMKVWVKTCIQEWLLCQPCAMNHDTVYWVLVAFVK